jgi:hypothetical protein
MVSVPDRWPPGFAATAKPTLPLPAPDAPLVIVSHGAPAVAVHAHDGAEAVTTIDPGPPLFEMSCPLGAMPKLQGGGGAAWDTVNG